MSNVKVQFGAEDNGLGATVQKLNSSLDKIDQNAKQASSSIDTGFKKMAVGGAAAGAAMAATTALINGAFRAVTAVVDNFGEALNMGGELNDLSARTGEAAGKLLILQRAFTNNGMEADKVGSSINKLQKFLNDAATGSQANVESLKSLGLSLSDLDGKTPTEQMRMFAEKITQIDDPTRRAGIAMDIFGKSGGELLPLFSNFSKELETAKTQLGSMPDVMDKSAGSFDSIGDNITVLKGKVTELAAGFLDKAAPALAKFTDMLTGIDAAGWGEKMMSMVLKVTDILIGAFKNPLLYIDMIGTALIAAAKSFGNFLINSIIDLGNTIGVKISAGFEIVVNNFKAMMINGGMKYLEFLTDGLIKAASILGGDVEQIAKNIGEPMKTSFRIAAMTYDGEMQKANRKIEDNLAVMMENTKKSTVDFFGAQPELDRLRRGTAKLEEDGRKFREQFSESKDIMYDMTKDIKPVPMFAWNMKDHLEKGAVAMEKAADKVKETMLLSQKIIGDINEAEKKQGIDKNGRIERKIKAELDRGNFDAARRLSEKIAFNEREQSIRGVGKDRDNRNIVDIAKAEGINTFGKSQEQLRAEIMKKRQEGLKPENKGLNKQQVEAKNNPAKVDPVDTLTKIATKIHDLVAKIEPKLPQHALN